jgi:hypothetical protein
LQRDVQWSGHGGPAPRHPWAGPFWRVVWRARIGVSDPGGLVAQGAVFVRSMSSGADREVRPPATGVLGPLGALWGWTRIGSFRSRFLGSPWDRFSFDSGPAEQTRRSAPPPSGCWVHSARCGEGRGLEFSIHAVWQPMGTVSVRSRPSGADTEVCPPATRVLGPSGWCFWLGDRREAPGRSGFAGAPGDRFSFAADQAGGYGGRRSRHPCSDPTRRVVWMDMDWEFSIEAVRTDARGPSGPPQIMSSLRWRVRGGLLQSAQRP